MTQQNQPVGSQAASDPTSGPIGQRPVAKGSEQPIPSTIHVPAQTENIPQQQLPHLMAAHAPLFDSQGRITREGIFRTVQNGGSVQFGDVNISSLDKVPTEAQVAAFYAKQAQTNLQSMQDGAKRGLFNQAEIDAAQKKLDEANAAVPKAQAATAASIDQQIAELEKQRAAIPQPQQPAQGQPSANETAGKGAKK